jgi:hypothetical protein
MAENVENLTLEYLRRPDAKLDRLTADVREVVQRLGSVERQTAAIPCRFRRPALRSGPPEHRLDRIDQRLARVEKRPDLVDTP